MDASTAATLDQPQRSHGDPIIHDLRGVRLDATEQIAAAMETFDLAPAAFLGA